MKPVAKSTRCFIPSFSTSVWCSQPSEEGNFFSSPLPCCLGLRPVIPAVVTPILLNIDLQSKLGDGGVWCMRTHLKISLRRAWVRGGEMRPSRREGRKTVAS